MVHDFKLFPELTNRQMSLYYFESPHRQITDGFIATVVNVHDGDSIKLRWNERNFDFPCRLRDILAPELDMPGGLESKEFLEKQILNQEVYILIDPKDRVDKWGRILGRVIFRGMDLNTMSVDMGFSTAWGGP